MKKIMVTVLSAAVLSGAIISTQLEPIKVDAQENKININQSNYDIEKNETWELKIDKEGNEVLQSNKGGLIREASGFDEDGNLVAVPLSEYLDILTNQTVDSQNVMDANSTKSLENPDDKQIKENKSPNEVWKYRYKQTSISHPYGSGVKVSPSVAGGSSGATISYGYNELIGAIYSGQASSNVSVRDALTIGVNFTWNHSATTNTTFGVSFKVDPGKTGYIEFKPKVTYTKGDSYRDVYNGAGVKIRTDNLGKAEGKSPKKLNNGFADGVFALVQR